MKTENYTLKSPGKHPVKFWQRTRPCKLSIQLNHDLPPCVEFYTPWWAWPLELLHRLIFGWPRLSGTFLPLLMMMAMSCAAVPPNGSPINRGYLTTALDGNQQDITNAANIKAASAVATSMLATNFSATNINLGGGKFVMNTSTGLLTGVVLSNAPGISGNVVGLTNGLWVFATFFSPTFYNAANQGNAFSSPGANEGAEQFGAGATATQETGTAVGAQAHSTGEDATTVGNHATASDHQTTAVAAQSSATARYASTFGFSSTASHISSAAIGAFSATTRANQIVLGVAGAEVLIPGSLTVLGPITNITHAGTNNFPVGSDVAFGIKTYSTLGDGVNVDLPVGTNTVIEISGNTSAATISGLNAGGAQRDGAWRILIYRQPYTLTYSAQNVVDPVAANRIITLTGQDRVSAGPCAASFIYSAAASRWILMGFESLSGFGVTNVLLSQIETNSALTGQVLRFNGTTWAPSFNGNTLTNLAATNLVGLIDPRRIAPTNGSANGDALTIDHGTNKWATISGGGGGGTYSLLFSQTASTTVSDATEETTLLNTGQGSTTIPANAITAGSRLRITLNAVCGTDGGGPYNPNLTLKFGGDLIKTFGTSVSTIDQSAYNVTFDLLFRTAGASVTPKVFRGALRYDVAAGYDINQTDLSDADNPVDTTASNTVDLTWTWDDAPEGNTVTANIITIELAKP